MSDVTAIAARVLAGRPYTEGDVRALAEAVFASRLFAAQPKASTARVEVDADEAVSMTMQEWLERDAAQRIREQYPDAPATVESERRLGTLTLAQIRADLDAMPDLSTNIGPEKKPGGVSCDAA